MHELPPFELLSFALDCAPPNVFFEKNDSTCCPSGFVHTELLGATLRGGNSGGGIALFVFCGISELFCGERRLVAFIN